MILTGLEIKRQIDLKNISIDPFDPEMVNPNSVDVRLGDTLKTYCVSKDDPLDPRYENYTVMDTIWTGGFVLQPGILYLASTLEYTRCGPFVVVLDGKSSLGRLGISIHQTAGYGDCGFEGQFTMEISVIHPVKVYAGMRIGQLRFHQVQGEIEFYKGRYQDSHGPIASCSYLGEKP